MSDRRSHTAEEDRKNNSTEHDTRSTVRNRDESGTSTAGRSRRSLVATAGVAFALSLSGCLSNPWGPEREEPSSDDGDPGETTDGQESEDTASDSDGTEPESDGTETVPPLEREPAQVVEVAPDGFQFDPGAFEIDVGETVHWIWKDSGHNLRVREKPDGSDWEGTPGSGSDTYGDGYEHGYTFETPGEYVYFCAPHQTLGLEGSFTVR